MNLFGMGTLEILVVLLVAFIFLGPERMVDAARLLGRATREVARLTAELPRLDLEEEQTTEPRTSGAGTGEAAAEEGPVAFRHGGEAADDDEAESPPKPESV